MPSQLPDLLREAATAIEGFDAPDDPAPTNPLYHKFWVWTVTGCTMRDLIHDLIEAAAKERISPSDSQP